MLTFLSPFNVCRENERMKFGQKPSAYFSSSAARALGNDYQAAYRLLANLPFYGEPALSSAVYAKLNLRRIHMDGK